MSIVEPERKTPVLAKVDVVVAGGGPAGIGAAIAAARNGVDTLMIERYGFLGGMFTAGFVLGIHTDKTMPLKEYEEEEPLVGGIAQELIEKLIEMRGTIPPEIWMKYANTTYAPSDPEMMKIALVEMVEDAGVKMLLHAYAVGTIVEDNEVKGIIIESKSGRHAILADVVVDCTGDGDVAVAAGAPWEKAPAKELLPMTLRVFLGGVDLTRAPKRSQGSKITPELREIYKKGIEEGVEGVTVLPEEKSRIPTLPMDFVEAFLPPSVVDKFWQRKGEVKGRHASYWGDSTDVEDLTKAEIWTRKKLLSRLNFLRKYVPGYEKCYLISTAPQIGIRESRRILGGYVLTFEKDIKPNRKHDDVINQARMPWAPAFDIPYRCLVPRKVEGLLTAGRCISIDHAAARIVAIRDEIQAIGLGQASGTSAALSVKMRIKPREVDVPTLQNILRKQGLNIPKR